MFFRLLSATAIMLILVFALLSASARSLPMAATQQYNADLTGHVFDHGEDTDGDGLFDFLVVDVEVDVYVAGTYQVGIGALSAGYYNSVYFNAKNETYLDMGMHNVSVLLNGIAIHGSKLDFTDVNYVSLSYGIGYSQFSTEMYDIPLSRTYSYTLFDDGATLTGDVYSEGKDTDGNGLFNYLELTVEINVTDEAEYELTVSEFHNVSEYGQEYVPVWNSTKAHLSPGLQNLTVSFLGALIYTSHAINISEIDSITLQMWGDGQSYVIDSASLVPLTRAYSYLEFDRLACFTGTVFDVAVDSDGNSRYDYLQLRVEVNVTEAGYYNVIVQNLLGNLSGTISVYATTIAYFDIGVQLANLTIYGPAIYMAHVNPVYIERMDIYNTGPVSFAVDTLSNVPLTTLYKYSDFELHASFIGTHSDVAVDTDGDGLFDYLAIGIDVNVTKAGTYGICSDMLFGQTAQGYDTQLYAYEVAQGYFASGVHRLFLNYSGPMLAQAHFSPTSISGMTLFESDPSYFELDRLSSVPLSKTYDQRLFDAPLRDTQVNFVVYPNGTVSLGGKFNYTHMYSPTPFPTANVTLDFSTNDNITTSTVNGTIIFPPSMAPLNSTSGHLSTQYADGLLNGTLDATMSMPPEASRNWPFNTSDFTLHSAYSNGTLSTDLSGQTIIPSQLLSMYPFNISDAVVLLDYNRDNINGNITFQAVSGLPLGDVMAHVSGNRTDLHFTGNLTVMYGNFYGIDVNSAVVDNTLGNFTSMVQDVSAGSLECTQLNTTRTPLYVGSTEYGENIDYNVTLHGNFTGTIARMLSTALVGYSAGEASPVIEAALESFSSSVRNASVKLSYYHTSEIATFELHSTSDVLAAWNKAFDLVPAAVPSGNKTIAEAWIKIANATAYAYNDVDFNASYSSATQELNLQGFVLANFSQAQKDILDFLPDTVSPELRGIFEAYVNTTYCKLKSESATFDSAVGTVNFVISDTYEGDYRAELNREKSFINDYLEAIYSQYPYQSTSPTIFSYPFSILNDTEVDINNFKAELRSGSDWIYVTFNGILLQPPKDQMDSIRFNLSRFFNMTSGFDGPLTEFDKLKITVAGGTDANQTVLVYAPATVPAPANASLDSAAMTWQNTAVSNLKDLRFLIAYQAVVTYGSVTEYIPIITNSTVSDFSFNPGAKSITFNVEGTAGSGFCNVTIPKSLLYASAANWTVKVDGTTLPPTNFTVTENAEYVFIYFGYLHSRHSVEITGTSVVPEFQPDLLLPLLIGISLVTMLIAVKQRRRLAGLKTRYQSLLHVFSSTLRRTKT
jgi:hypothetical protein